MKKIGFDIHGVIDDNPKLFYEMIKVFRKMGYEIHILTGSIINDEILDQIKSYNIHFDFIFSILGYHKKEGTHMWENEKGFWVDDVEWNKTKAIYCEENQIDFHIDDSRVYGDYFSTPFAHLSPKEDIPRLLEIKGEVDKDIINVFKKFEGYYQVKFI